MKISMLITLALLATTICTPEPSTYFNSKEYITGLTGAQKMDKLWEKINESKQSADWYPKATLLKLLTESYDPTYSHPGDAFPDDRLKLIHTVGAIAKAEYTSTDPKHPFTGILKDGAKNMLIRLSTAKETDTSKTSPDGAYENFVPGISLKFLIDNKQSTNLVAMYMTGGQNSWNFFKHDFTSMFDLSDSASAPEKLISFRFSTQTSFITSMGMNEICGQDQTGKVVDKVKIPFKIIFRPNADLQSKYPDSFEKSYLEQVAEIPEGTVIYEVWAQENPFCNPNKIGEIKLVSKLTTSNFGDLQLFFKHVMPDTDMNVYPEWQDYREQWGFLGRKTPKQAKTHDCPFMEALRTLY